MLITTIAAGIIGFLCVATSAATGFQRSKYAVAIGHDNIDALHGAIRAHGNLIEHAPIALIVLGFMEYNGANHLLVIALAGAFVTGRILHAVAMLTNPKDISSKFRIVGMLFTVAPILIGSVGAIYLAITQFL